MTASHPRVVVVGAGHAGGTFAALLRQYGHQGPIALIGEEPLAPYQRPPLSKAWLKGEADADLLALRPSAFYGEQLIDFRPDNRVTALHRASKTVIAAGGTRFAYDWLVIATGARPITLPTPGHDLAGVLYLRSAADAEQLKAALRPGTRLVVIGAGYVGLEVAASARALGAEVVVIEREHRVLARVAAEPVSAFVSAFHRARGVRLELESEVVSFRGAGGTVTGVDLGDGRSIACDVVVVGVGAHPNDEIAREAGLEVARGIVVDRDARSRTDPDIFAIGDVAHRPLPIYRRTGRLESVPNALEQAKQAAAAITGRPPPPEECPWQWSDQYDLKIQIAGYPFDADSLVLRGDLLSGSFAVFHLQGDRVQAVEAVNAPPEFMMGKQLILRRTPVDRGKLADSAVSMKGVAQVESVGVS